MKPQFTKPSLKGISQIRLEFWLDNEPQEDSNVMLAPSLVLSNYEPGSILDDDQLEQLEILYGDSIGIKDISRIMCVPDYGFLDVTTINPTKDNGSLIDDTIHHSGGVVHRIVPSGTIGKIRGAGPWINPGVLSKFVGKPDSKGKLTSNANIVRLIMGLPVGRITKPVKKIIENNPELLGPCERPYARFVKHHIEQLRLLTKGQSTGVSSGLSGTLSISSRQAKLQLLDDIEAIGDPKVLLQDVLILPSKALMTITMTKRKRNLLSGFSRYSSIAKSAFGYNTPAIEPKDSIARDKRAAHILMSYLEANAQVTYKILPGKRKLLKRTAMGQRSPVSGRHVLASLGNACYLDEVRSPDSSLIVQGTAQLIYFIQQQNKKKGIYETPEEVYLKIKNYTHRPTKEMYEGLEYILQTYKDLGLKGIPLLVQRFPSSRAANASILFATEINKDPNDMCLSMSPQLFKSYNGDTDGDEVTNTMIPHSVARELSEQMSPRDHFLAIGPLPYDTKLTSTDALYRMGVSLWFTSEKVHGVNGDKIFDLV